MTSLSKKAFFECPELSSVSIPISVTSFETSAFYKCVKLETVIIPENLTTISDSTFSYCYGLKYINIPDSVTTMGERVFYECYSLESINISKGLSTIPSYTFYNCYGLKYIDIPENILTLSKYAFQNAGLESIHVPDTVESFGPNLFYSCANLTSIEIPTKITIIDQNVFYKCSGLESIIIPCNVLTIDRSAFYICSKLKSVSLPENLTSIGQSAFYQCTSLESITIPGNVNSIGSNAFYECSALSSVTYEGKMDLRITYTVFDKCTNLLTIYVPIDYANETFCKINVTRIQEETSTISSYSESPVVSSSGESSASESEDESAAVPDVTEAPNPDVVIIDIPDYINETELDRILTEEFANMSSDGDYHDKIIIFNASQISFNSNLSPNHFIQPMGESEINLKGGNLNLILPASGKVKVDVNDEKAQLSINGEGQILINNAQSETPSVILTSKSQIKGLVDVTLSENIDTFTIDSVEFANSGELSVKNEKDGKESKVNVNRVLVKENSNAAISNMEILDSLTVVQTSTMSIDNVVLEKATVNFEVDFVNGDTNKNPFFRGNFKNRPKSLVLRKVSGDESQPEKGNEYTLVAGEFEDQMCQEWLNSIDYGNTGFNDKSCEDNNDAYLLVENKRIVMRLKDGDNDNKKHKLSAGQIAAIVIGCTAFVAIVVVVVVVVIKKRGRGYEKSETQVLKNSPQNESFF